MFIDKYEVFELFPKTEFQQEGVNRLIPLTDKKITNIYFMYILIIVAVGIAMLS